jgi:hypothetical protein
MKLNPRQIEAIAGFLRLELGEEYQWMLFLDCNPPGKGSMVYSGDQEKLEKRVCDWAKQWGKDAESK